MQPLAPEVIEAIKQSTESVRACAARLGVSKSVVQKVRRGVHAVSTPEAPRGVHVVSTPEPVHVVSTPEAPRPSTWTELAIAAYALPEGERWRLVHALGGLTPEGVVGALKAFVPPLATHPALAWVAGQAGPKSARELAALHPDRGAPPELMRDINARVAARNVEQGYRIAGGFELEEWIAQPHRR